MDIRFFTRLVPAFALASVLAAGACSSPVAMDDDGNAAVCDPDSPEYNGDECSGGDGGWVTKNN